MLKKFMSFDDSEEWSESDDESLESLKKKIFRKLKSKELKKQKIDKTKSKDLSLRKENGSKTRRDYDDKEKKLKVTENLPSVDPVPSTSSAPEPSTSRMYHLPPRSILKAYPNAFDVRRLMKGKSINSRIVDWYLRNLYDKKLSKMNQERTFIYDSQFFSILILESFGTEEESSKLDIKYVKSRTFAEHVNLFKKDFIIIPIDEDHIHWYLMIICFPKRTTNFQETPLSSSDEISSSEDVDPFEVRFPCILVFDSMEGSPKEDDVEIVRNYLSFEYLKRYKRNLSFADNAMRCIYPEIPKQSNFTDSGIFLLLYVEYFFKAPIRIYRPPIDSLINWFPPSAVTEKRIELARRLQHKLLKKYIKTGTSNVNE